VTIGTDHIGGSLLEDIQVDTKGLHLIGVVVGTKRLEVIGERYLDSIEMVYSLLDISYLEGTSHLASSLENILDHVLASAPHLVTLLQEVLAEAHPVDLVRVEGGRHQEIVHAVHEVVHNDPVEAVRVSLKSPVN